MSLLQLLGGSATWVFAAQTGVIALLGVGYAKQHSQAKQVNRQLVTVEDNKNSEIAALKVELKKLRVEQSSLKALVEETEAKRAKATRALSDKQQELAEAKKKLERRVYSGSSSSGGSDSSSSSDGDSDAQKKLDTKLCLQANERCKAGCVGLSYTGKGGTFGPRVNCEHQCNRWCW